MRKKPIIMIVIIAFPIGLIFLFQFFSEGRYDIPVFYEQGVRPDTLQKGTCIERTGQQYFVTNNQLPQNVHRIVHFERMDGPVLKTRLEELERVQDVYSVEQNVLLTTYTNGSSMKASEVTDYGQRIFFLENFWKINELDSATWSDLKYCDMVMSYLDNRVVLVDSKNRIRGYYNILEREETDRLIDEIGILLTNKELQ